MKNKSIARFASFFCVLLTLTGCNIKHIKSFVAPDTVSLKYIANEVKVVNGKCHIYGSFVNIGSNPILLDKNIDVMISIDRKNGFSQWMVDGPMFSSCPRMLVLLPPTKEYISGNDAYNFPVEIGPEKDWHENEGKIHVRFSMKICLENPYDEKSWINKEVTWEGSGPSNTVTMREK